MYWAKAHTARWVADQAPGIPIHACHSIGVLLIIVPDDIVPDERVLYRCRRDSKHKSKTCATPSAKG